MTLPLAGLTITTVELTFSPFVKSLKRKRERVAECRFGKDVLEKQEPRRNAMTVAV